MINGTNYNVKIIAVYADGTESPPSLVKNATPGTASAPTIISVTPGNQKLTVFFTPPKNTGGFNITNYYADALASDYIVGGPLSTPATTSPLVITELQNGVTYRVRLRAINQSGVGEFSNEVQGTPRSEVPGPPTINSLAVGNSALIVNFSYPSNDGGEPVTSYKYSINGGVTKVDYPATTSPLEIDNLTNGTKYSVVLYAVNTRGVGAASNAFEGAPTQGKTPSAPTIMGVTPGVKQLSISFNPPVTNNGFPILRYQYKLNSGKWTTRRPETLLTSPLILTKLFGNTTYKLKIRAVNAAGAGAASALAIGSVGKSQPSAPTITDALIRSKYLNPPYYSLEELWVTVEPPVSDGGAPITHYIVLVDEGGGPTAAGVFKIISVKSTDKIDGFNVFDPQFDGSITLRAKRTKTPGSNTAPTGARGIIAVSVVATNELFVTLNNITTVALGDPSDMVYAAEDPDNIPLNAPTLLSVEATGRSSMIISFDNPLGNIVQDIRGYQYSINNGATFREMLYDAENLTATISNSYDPDDEELINDPWNLLPGETYRVKLNALFISEFGYVEAGRASNMLEVTMQSAEPTAPTISSIYGLAQQLVVNFSRPSVTGGAILDYEYSLNGTAYVSSGVSNSPITINNTPAGAVYTVTLRARNAVGYSPASNSAEGLAGTPSSPSITSIISGLGSGLLEVYFDPPASLGGSPIIRYHYSTDNGATYKTTTSTASPLVVRNLNNGESYPIVIKAENMQAIGPPSLSLTGVPCTTPPAPTLTQVIADPTVLEGLKAYFTPPTNNGGAAITGYEYVAGGSWLPATYSNDGAVAIRLYKPKAGASIAVAVRAVNSAGKGAASNTIYGLPTTAPERVKSVTLSCPVNNPYNTGASGAISVSIEPGNNGGSPITHYRYRIYDAYSGTDYFADSSQAQFIATNGNQGPFSFVIPQPFPAGMFFRIKVEAINLGITGPQPFVPYSSGMSPAQDSNIVHIVVAVPRFFYDWVNFETKVTLPTPSGQGGGFTVLLKSYHVPCYSAAKHIGDEARKSFPFYTGFEYSIDQGATYQTILDLDNPNWWCHKALAYNMFGVAKDPDPNNPNAPLVQDVRHVELARCGPESIALPSVFIEHKVYVRAFNKLYRSAPYIININPSTFPELNVPITLDPNASIPTSLTIDEGDFNTQVFIHVVGSYPITYTWYRNNQPFIVINNPNPASSYSYVSHYERTLYIKTAIPDFSGNYHMVATNKISSYTGPSINITVTPKPIPQEEPSLKTRLPNYLTAYAGDPLELSVVFAGNRDVALFKWYHNNNLLTQSGNDEKGSPVLTFKSTVTPQFAGAYRLELYRVYPIEGETLIDSTSTLLRVENYTQPVVTTSYIVPNIPSYQYSVDDPPEQISIPATPPPGELPTSIPATPPPGELPTFTNFNKTKFVVINITGLEDGLVEQEGHTFIQILADFINAPQLNYTVNIAQGQNPDFLLASGSLSLADTMAAKEAPGHVYKGGITDVFKTCYGISKHNIFETRRSPKNGEWYDALDGRVESMLGLFTLVLRPNRLVQTDSTMRMVIWLSNPTRKQNYNYVTINPNTKPINTAQQFKLAFPPVPDNPRYRYTQEYMYRPLHSTGGLGYKYRIGGGVCSNHKCVNTDGKSYKETGYLEYNVQIYRIPKNFGIAWRFRGENDLYWRPIYIIRQEATIKEPGVDIDIFATYTSPTKVYEGFTLYSYFSGCANPSWNYRGNLVAPDDPNLDWIAYYFHDNEGFPAILQDVAMVHDFDGNFYPELWNSQMIRILYSKATFELCKTQTGAIDFRQLEFVVYPYSTNKYESQVVVPYSFNLMGKAANEYYSSSPAAQSLVMFDAPDATWDTPRVRQPTQAQIATFATNYPEWVNSIKNNNPNWASSWPGI